MPTIGDMINQVLSSQATDTTAVNDSERDGNISDILFRISQPTVGVSVAGGATTTTIAPSTLVNDLASGQLSWRVLVLLTVVGLGLYWLFKR